MTFLGSTIVESGGSTGVDESGTTDTFTIVLDAQPTSSVVLTITSDDTGEATVPASATSSANWNTPQTITVTGVNDGTLIDGNQDTNVTVSIDDANSDDGFDALEDQTVVVTTTDDDIPEFTVTETNGSTAVAESGTTDTFTVVLDAQPETDVVAWTSFHLMSTDNGNKFADIHYFKLNAPQVSLSQVWMTTSLTGP